MQRVLHSACCTRVLLHIRTAFVIDRQRQEESDNSTFPPFTSVITDASPSFNRDEYTSPDHRRLPQSGSTRRADTLSSGTVVYLPYDTVDSGSTGDTIEMTSMRKKTDSTKIETPIDNTFPVSEPERLV